MVVDYTIDVKKALAAHPELEEFVVGRAEFYKSRIK